MNNESIYLEQIKVKQDLIGHLMKEISQNKQDILSLEKSLYDIRLQIANDLTDLYNQELKKQTN